MRRRAHWRLHTAARAAGTAAFLAIGFTPAHAEHTSQAWQGQLEVLQQAGVGCASQPAVPYRIPVRAVRQGDSARPIVFWGDMQVAFASSRPQAAVRGMHELTLPGKPRPFGSIVVDQSDSQLSGLWREHGSTTSPGCSFTQAVLQLDSVVDPADKGAMEGLAAYLVRLAAARAQQALATTPQAAKAPADALAALAGQLPPPGEADRSLAEIFLGGAEEAGALRQRQASLPMLQAASALYRRIATTHPEDAALALSAEARAQHRAGGLVAATPLIEEGLEILGRSQKADSGAASSLLGLHGAWLLKSGQVTQATAAFTRALHADQARSAPPFDMAIALTNLAAATLQAGNRRHALALYRQALPLAQQAGEPAESLVQLINENIGALSEPRGGSFA